MKRTLLIAAVVAALVFGVVAYANAEPASDAKSVNVTANVKPKIVLTVPTTVPVGDLYPDESKTVTVSGITVSSNKAWTLSAETTSIQSGVVTLSSTGSSGAKGNNVPVTDVEVTAKIDYTVDPGNDVLLGTIKYTATQVTP